MGVGPPPVWRQSGALAAGDSSSRRSVEIRPDQPPAKAAAAVDKGSNLHTRAPGPLSHSAAGGSELDADEVADLYDEFSRTETIRGGRARFFFQSRQEAPPLPWGQGDCSDTETDQGSSFEVLKTIHMNGQGDGFQTPNGSLSKGREQWRATEAAVALPAEQHIFVHCSQPRPSPWIERYVARKALRDSFQAWRLASAASHLSRWVAARRRRSLLVRATSAWVKELAVGRAAVRSLMAHVQMRLLHNNYRKWNIFTLHCQTKRERVAYVRSWYAARTKKAVLAAWLEWAGFKCWERAWMESSEVVWRAGRQQMSLRRWRAMVGVARCQVRLSEVMAEGRLRHLSCQALKRWSRLTRHIHWGLLRLVARHAHRLKSRAFRFWAQRARDRHPKTVRRLAAKAWRAASVMAAAISRWLEWVQEKQEKDLNLHVAWSHRQRSLRCVALAECQAFSADWGTGGGLRITCREAVMSEKACVALARDSCLSAWRDEAAAQRLGRATEHIAQLLAVRRCLWAWHKALLEAPRLEAEAYRSAGLQRRAFVALRLHWQAHQTARVMGASKDRRLTLSVLLGWQGSVQRLSAKVSAIRSRRAWLLCATAWMEWRRLASSESPSSHSDCHPANPKAGNSNGLAAGAEVKDPSQRARHPNGLKFFQSLLGATGRHNGQPQLGLSQGAAGLCLRANIVT